MEQERAERIIQETRDMYDRIAPDFTRKRSRITPDVVDLKKYAAPGDAIADIGCGSGRLSELFPKEDYSYLGCDFSQAFLRIASELYPDRAFVLMRGLSIPIQTASINTVYSLAMLHHIPSHAYRIEILKEMRRILKPKGSLVLTVWRQSTSSSALPGMDPGDMLIPYTISGTGEKVERYIHAFSEDELVQLAAEAGFVQPETFLQQRGSTVVNENICLIARNP